MPNYIFDRAIPAHELQAGMRFEHRGAVCAVVYRYEEFEPPFDVKTGLCLEHPVEGRIAADLPRDQPVYTLTVSAEPIRPARFADDTSWSWFEDCGDEPVEDEEGLFEMSEDIELKQINIEGFGEHAGKKITGVLVDQDSRTATIRCKNTKGAEQDVKFNLADGKAVKSTADKGYKIGETDLKFLQEGKKTTRRAASQNPVAATEGNLKPTGKCLCGCGTEVKGRFAQGHDAKFHSMVKKSLRGLLGEKEVPDTVKVEVLHLGGFGSKKDEAKATKSVDTTDRPLFGAAKKAQEARLAREAETANAPAEAVSA